jgi:hypothetical protein
MAFKSGFERTVAANLSSRGLIWKYEPTQVPYILKSDYNPDFYFPDYGFYVETKGKLVYEDRRKHLAVKKQHPELDLRFCFMEAHRKMPGTKSTHAQWADRNGFLWCDKEIPEEWFNDRQ